MGYLKSVLVEITKAVEKMMFLLDPNFEKTTNKDQKLIINDVAVWIS